MQIVRQFSVCGPCLTLGRLTKTTPSFFVFEEWHGGDRFGPETRRVSRDRHALNHIEPCHSCRDHARTQYPNGYID
jgi:hypothetical protein